MRIDDERVKLGFTDGRAPAGAYDIISFSAITKKTQHFCGSVLLVPHPLFVIRHERRRAPRRSAEFGAAALRQGYRLSEKRVRAALMKPKLKLQHVEDALRQAGGIISTAAKILQAAYGSCTPRTVRNYVKRHPRLVKVIEETVELNLDTAESQLMTLIANGNLGAVIFYLKTKGKARGYVERVEATGSGGGPIKIELSRSTQRRPQARTLTRPASSLPARMPAATAICWPIARAATSRRNGPRQRSPRIAR